VLGDLREEFGDRCFRDGDGAARRWYWRQVLHSLRPTLSRRFWRRRSGFRGPVRSPTTTRMNVMNGVYRDLRHALRLLVRRPLYGVIAVVTLALGIGGTAAITTVVHDTLLRPLPYPAEDVLVWFWDDFSWTPQEVLHMRGQWRGFDGVAAWTTTSTTFRIPDGISSQVSAVQGSDELFEVLERLPAMGRTFRPGDDAPDAPPVVVVSHSFWEAELGADPQAIGRSILLDGATRTVVGVMPEDFYFPDRTARLWIPGPLSPDDGYGNWTMLGRLPENRSPGTMDAELAQITGSLGERFEYTNLTWDRTRDPELTPLRVKLLGDVRLALWLTFGAVALILMMSCANVAALTIGRMQSRRRELGVRTALGAGRMRVARQLVTEVLVVGLIAGVLAAVVATAAFDGIVRSLPLTDPLVQDLGVDWRLFGAALGFALLSSFLVGLAPAVSFLRSGPSGGLRDTGRGNTGSGRGERFLVVFEVAVAVVLVTGAALMSRSVERLQGVPAGFEPIGLLRVDLTLGGADFDAAERARMHDLLRDRIAELPGVETAATIQVPPLWGPGWNFGLRIQGREDLDVSTLYRIVTPDYFEATRIDLVRGRTFRTSDDTASEPVVVVNEAFVREFFPAEDPLGRQLGSGLDDNWATIVGVVEDAATTGLRAPPAPVRYVLGRQYGFFPESGSLLVRGATGTDVEAAAPLIRSAINDLDPRIAVAGIQSMERVYERAMGRTGQLVPLLAGLGALGLILGAVGVYGVVAHFVSRRTREWGVRLALGQSPRRVLRQVLASGVTLVGGGVMLGLVASWVAARYLASLLYEVAPTDPVSFVSAASILILVGVVSAAIPAMRASRVDPVISLKAE